VPSSPALAQLPNGVAVELLGIGPYPLRSEPWWRPDGSGLPEAPYDGIISAGAIPGVGRTGFWLAVRVGNLPEGWNAGLESPDTTSDTSENRPSKAGRPQNDLRWLMVEAEPNQTTCTVRCNLAAPWQTLARSSVPLTSPPRTAENGVVFSDIREGFQGGRVMVSGRDSSGEGVSVTITGRVGGRDEDRSVGVGDIRRVVAVTKDGKTQTPPSDGLYFSEGAGKATAYFPRLSLAGVQELQFQVRPLTRVEFKNVPLRRGLKTDLEARVQTADADDQAAPPAGTDQEKRIILPEADRQKVVLDLATGELVPLPPAGPEPEKLEQALRKLGKGDLLYDCDSGDRTLILVRGATSEQAQGDTGEPPWKGYLIGPHLPGVLTVKTAEGRQYKVTILAADDEACTLKYSSTSPGKGALELRIAPRQDEVESSVVAEYRKALAEGHTVTGGRYIWRQVQPGTDLGPFVITQTREGTTWLLVHDDDLSIMVPAQGWKLTQVGRGTDANGRPMVTLEFDDAGAERMLQLTKANDGRLLAEIVFGVVVSAPIIHAGRSGFSRAVITGNFTDREVDDLIATLRRGMVESPTQEDGSSPAPSTGVGRSAGGGAPAEPGTVNLPAGSSAAASWQDVGPAVPPDANDARTLAPGVVLEGSGADVEEKAFISCLRDLGPTAGRQSRFVLVTKEGQTLEPRYYTSLPRDGGKVWEKFTFDASHLPWKLSHFQLQSRLIPADGRAVAPSPREEVLAQAARPLSGVSETQPGAAGLQASGGPPGRFALSFDGAGNYLYIPDSDSLRQAAGLTVEMWIKPQLPEGPHINRPRWGLLAHGAYLGTGRATVSGFGIKIDGLDPASRNLMIDYGEALEDGISCTILGELFSNNWVHISHTFGHGSYRPAPGHPMIVGRYLIPSEDPYPGQIGEIRLWDSDRTRESDIHRYENVALTGKEPGLVACWTFEEGRGQIAYDISPNANHARLGSSIEPDAADPQWINLTATGPGAANEISGRVVDPNGRPVAGAQVALCTKDKGVDIQAGQLLPTRWGGKGGEIVKTDAQGRFSFASVPDEFHLIAAHDAGFAWITNKELPASGDLRLEPWGRIEGTLKIGRELGAGERISLQRAGNRSAADQNIHLDYETYADRSGRFTFARVPPTWMEVGYLIRTGDSTSSDTGRTPIHLLSGQNLKMTLGGEGRLVIGKFVPPEGYKGPVYFGEGLRALQTWHPDLPKPANYDQMTRREQQQWLNEWIKTPQAEAYYDALWHDLNRRHYTFRIEDDGTFRIEDVIPGRYKFTVWFEERLSGQGRPEEIGAYYGTIEIPAIPGGRTDEPLDLGNLTVGMRSPPLHVGDMAPLFEAKSLDGKDVRLADYRGRFVLLSFWQPTFHPELDRLKELYQTYSGAGKLAIIDFAGGDALEEVKQYLAEHQTEWPEIYLGRNWDSDIFKQYGDPSASYILLVNPEGKIVATWLREEKLTQTVKDAIGKLPAQ
jgi:hypothetical protein